jgi:hypothetical protein
MDCRLKLIPKLRDAVYIGIGERIRTVETRKKEHEADTRLRRAES